MSEPSKERIDETISPELKALARELWTWAWTRILCIAVEGPEVMRSVTVRDTVVKEVQRGLRQITEALGK